MTGRLISPEQDRRSSRLSAHDDGRTEDRQRHATAALRVTTMPTVQFQLGAPRSDRLWGTL